MKLEALHELIINYIEETNLPIFLTGKAGTGKTTFLRHIRETTKKNLAVVAPTAVAAIQAGGVTIHSFFQMPLGPLLPPANNSEFAAKSFSQEKSKLIKCLDLLIIDEISMVRADTIDYIDRALRFIKGSSQPFGGVQLLMIGDLYQLPPVFQNDWHLLSKFYRGPYFFDSQIFRQTTLLTFELNKVHRQSDPTFIAMLNQIRSGTINESQLAQLNNHYQPEINEALLNDYVTLTTHNPLVKSINEQRLAALPGTLHLFKAKIVGDFSPEAYPTDAELALKPGAMVMFIKNDSSGAQKYYNGKTAKIEQINGDHISVSFPNEDTTFNVPMETWENTKYSLAETDQKVTQSSVGSFSQFPLRLAWAITIHKSQGLTFDKAVVDVGAAFAHGQAYVALSRCRSLQGLILKQKVSIQNIITDQAVTKFMENALQSVPDQHFLVTVQNELQIKYIIDGFDLTAIYQAYLLLKEVALEVALNQTHINEQFDTITALIVSKSYTVAQRFIAKELQSINISNNPEAKPRIQKAAIYFLPHLREAHDKLLAIHQTMEGSPYHPEYFPALNQTLELLETKIEVLQVLTKEIDIQAIHNVTKRMAAHYKTIDGWKKIPVEQAVENPSLYAQLVSWRKAVAEKRKVLDYHVISDQVLAEISTKLPRTLTALAKIKNVGEGTASAYGDPILRLVKLHLGETDLFG